MKRFLSFLYTNSFKGFLLILILLFSFLSSHYTLKTALLYKEDPIALVNVLKQKGNFNFEDSVYLKSSIESAVQQVLFYCLETNKNTREYSEVSEKIAEYKDLSFAVINHTSEKIVSNIKELNGKDSSENVRQYFPDNRKSLLIVYDAKNPYFENGTNKDFVSFVNEFSNNFQDNFDVYIYFGENFSFAGSEEDFKSRDETMLGKLNSTLTYSMLFLVFSIVLFIFLFILTGKKEYGGRQYLSAFDKIPNDILIPMYVIIILCTMSLYSNSLHMLIKTTYYESYWFNFTPDFYIMRGSLSYVFLFLAFMLLCFTLKRQYKNKTLFKNTHIYNLISSYKSIRNKE